MRPQILALVAILAASLAPLAAQEGPRGEPQGSHGEPQGSRGELRGTVRDAGTQEPIANAVITARGERYTTDRTGVFVFTLPAGDHTIEISAPGYASVSSKVTVRVVGLQALDVQLPQRRFSEDLIVTATGHPEPADDLVQGVGTIGSNELARVKGIGLDEALNFIPGIKAESQNETQEVRVSIRGRGVRTGFGVTGIRMLVDGMPETDATGETSDLSGIDPAALDHVEAVKGPMAANYGASSSGVINLITPQGTAIPTADLHSSLGSYGFHKVQGVVGGAYRPLRYYGSYSGAGEDGYRAHSRLDSHHFSGRFDVDAGKGVSVSTFIRASSYDAQLPGNLSRADATNNPTQASALFVRYGARSQIDRFRLGATGAKRWQNGSELSVSGFGGPADFAVFVPFVVLQGHRRASGGGAKYFYPGTVGRFQNTVNIGLDLQRTTEDRTDPVNDLGEATAVHTRNEQRAISNVAVSALDTLSLTPSLSLRGGINYSTVGITIHDFLFTRSGSKNFSQASFIVGARYRLGSALSGYASVSTGFDPPTISAIGRPPGGGAGINTTLAPERSTNIEGGAQWNVAPRATATASLFHLRVRDEIVPTGTGLPQEIFTNAAEASHNGLELAMRLPLTRELSVRGAYTYSHFTYVRFISAVGNVAGNLLPGTPANRGTIALTYSGRTGIVGGVTWLANGKMFADDGNRAASDAYNVTNLNLGYERTVGHLRLGVLYRLNNAFDERYSAYLVINDRFSGYYYPSPTRNWSGMVRAGWTF